MASLNRSEPKREFRWTAQRHEAARLLAENDLTDREIAAQLSISRTTLHNWKQDSEFAGQVGDNIGQIQAAMMRHTIAKKHKRIAVLDQLHDKLLEVIQERAVEYEDDAPGASTGLVTKTYRMIGTGRDATLVTEWGVDNSTVRQIMSLEEQAAKELGQWVEKGELAGPGGEPLIIRSVSVPLPVRDDA